MPGPDDKPVDAAVAAPAVPDNSPPSAPPEAPGSAPPDPAAAASPAPAADAAPATGADAVPVEAAKPAEDVDATLLDKFDEKNKAPAEAKPDEAAKPDDQPKPVEEPKPEDGKPVEEPPKEDAQANALVPVDYFAAETGIKLPETITMDDALKGEFTTALDLLRTDPLKGAQALVDLHNAQMVAYDEFKTQEQWRAFRETKAEWVKQVMADPILGGAGHDTAMAQVATARDMLASRAKPGSEQYARELAELNTALKVTGAGDNPAILRFMHNAARYVREASLPPPNPKPPADIGKNPNTRGKALMYDNPTSQPQT